MSGMEGLLGSRAAEECCRDPCNDRPGLRVSEETLLSVDESECTQEPLIEAKGI